MTVSVEVVMDDQRPLEEFESAVAGMDEVVEARRLFGSPYWSFASARRRHGGHERRTIQLLVMLGVSRTISHQTMKPTKRDL